MKPLAHILQAGLTVLALTLVGNAFAEPARAGGTGDWRTYVNVRFRYQICYPATLLTPRGEPDNGDGEQFKATDGGVLAVYGRNNALGQSLAAAVRMAGRDLTGKAGTISYRAARARWEVISGDDGGSSVFYSKTIQRGDQFLIFELRYPKTAAARYKPVIDRLAYCFQSTR